MDDLETKRAAARRHRGVTFDPRLGKFTAEITIGGERTYLGSFATAEAAGAAYEEQRAAMPVTRRHQGKAPFHVYYANFLRSCVKDERGDPAVGQIFEAPDGQRFRLGGVERARKDGEYSVWSLWNSRCRVCGARYFFSINRRVQTVRCMLRTCEEHRGEKTDLPRTWADPEEWSRPVDAKDVYRDAGARPKPVDNRPEIVPGPVLPGDGRYDNFRRAGRAAGYNNDEIVERLKAHVRYVCRDAIEASRREESAIDSLEDLI